MIEPINLYRTFIVYVLLYINLYIYIYIYMDIGFVENCLSQHLHRSFITKLKFEFDVIFNLLFFQRFKFHF